MRVGTIWPICNVWDGWLQDSDVLANSTWASDNAAVATTGAAFINAVPVARNGYDRAANTVSQVKITALAIGKTVIWNTINTVAGHRTIVKTTIEVIDGP